jgi:hypothetical protein
MGTTTSIDSWIGKEDQVAKFLTIAVKTLDDLYKETNQASQKRSPPEDGNPYHCRVHYAARST